MNPEWCQDAKHNRCSEASLLPSVMTEPSLQSAAYLCTESVYPRSYFNTPTASAILFQNVGEAHDLTLLNVLYHRMFTLPSKIHLVVLSIISAIFKKSGRFEIQGSRRPHITKI